MINLFKKKISKRANLIISVVITVIFGVFLKIKAAFAVAPLVPLAVAGVSAAILWFYGKEIVSLSLFAIIGGLAAFFSWVVGMIQGVFTAILFQIVTYNDFINEEVVKTGWVVVRDVSNMFFILILLIIAFATILRIESYSWKKNLPKLLIMAVLINFSKTICGLAIDFSQVIMLTFVNAFSNGGPGNLYNAFGIQKLYTIQGAANAITTSEDTTKALNSNYSFAITGSLVLGLIMLIIACIVIACFVIILLFRIIMLWILIILSPLAFLAMAIPAGAKYASQWTSEFSKYIVIGPVMAFFLWLALSMSTAGRVPIDYKFNAYEKGGIVELGTGSEISQPANMKNFLVTTLFLLAGLMMAQQVGGAVGSVAGKGLDWAKKSSKFVGKVAGYVPAQYAKRAGYGLGDVALGQLKKAPIIGSLALETQGRLKMHRDYAEEKDTKYMQYMEEQDLDRIITRQRSSGVVSFLAKGMESKRQMFKRALVEKMKRGDEWGQTMEEKRANKTRAMIDLAQIGGHSITSSGEDAFREADLLKLWHEFRNKNAGVIDDNEMRSYFFGGTGVSTSGRNYNYKKGLEGAANSEYYRTGGWQDPNTGFWYDHQNPTTGQGENFVSPNSMLVYTLSRMRMNEVHNLHHENFIPRVDATGEHYDALEAIYDDGNGAMRSLAQIRDRGTRQQKRALRAWMANRLAMEQGVGYAGSTHYRDLWNDYQTANPGATEDQFLNAAMGNGGIQLGGTYRRDRLGGSRAIMGETHSAEVASGITGLDRANRGVMAANFSDLGLEKVAAKYFDGVDKAEIASRISGSLRENGMAEAAAKAVEDQINKASYLILHNKEAGVSLAERKTSYAHELMHARLGANFNQDELKGVWNSMDENSKNSARKQISAKWGGNMSEEAIMNEYFAEGLTAKTRWGKGAVLSLNKKSESGLDNLLKIKGSNITAFTSNVTKNRPTSDDVRQSMANNVDGSLKETLDELIGTLKDVGNGFSSIENFSSNLNNLQRSVERNRTSLDKSVKNYKEVNDKLSNLANRTT